MLYGIALNILFVNLDSYAGSASEIMLYRRQDTGQFVHVHWDLNESFGTTGDGSPLISNPPTLDPFWLPTTSSGPGGGGMGGNSARPLIRDKTLGRCDI
ncbi:MAG: CotH kinase family protein [Paludibaculum sp.]